MVDATFYVQTTKMRVAEPVSVRGPGTLINFDVVARGSENSCWLQASAFATSAMSQMMR
jgi:hypothetical protein